MSSRFQSLEVILAEPGFDLDSPSLTVGDSLRVLPGRRKVFRAKLIDGSADLVVKCYLPHAKQTRDWQCEWEGLLGLKALGLPGPNALAVCRSESGDICVLMEAIPGAVTLGTFLERSTQSAPGAILSQLARLVDRMHEAGVRQSDQHIDNWAVSGGSIYLLDAGTLRFTEKPLDVSDRIADLAAICATLPPAAERAFRHFVEAEYGAGLGEERDRILGSELSGATAQVQRERARRYFKKTRRTCTEFVARAESGRSGMYARPAPEELIDRFFSDPEVLIEEGERLKSGNTCTVQRISHNGRDYVLKRYNVKPLFTQLRRSLVPSRASISWSNAWVLNLVFVRTAKPLAFLDEEGFPRGRSYLLMDAIDGQLLPEYLEQVSSDEDKLGSLVDGVGAVWDTLGQLRAVHGDLKATNWMVDPEGRVYLFDLDSFHFGLTGAGFLRGRNKDMRRFLKNWESLPEVARRFQRRMEGGTAP